MFLTETQLMTNKEKCFRGLQKTTLLDFPGSVACVLFVGGCSFRCPYCYNSSLVRREEPELLWNTVWDFLQRRRKVLDGVCVSGGEPTQAPFLPDFLRGVRELGYRVKLDTNGYHPEQLASMLNDKLVDFVAMDIKNSPSKYATTSGLACMDVDRVKQSISIIKESGVEYEFRTTIAMELHDLLDIKEMMELVGKGSRYALQPVRHDTPSLSGRVFTPPSPATLRQMGERLEDYFEEVIIHGERPITSDR